MPALAAVVLAYKAAWSRRYLIIGVYLGLRLLIYAALAPILGLLLQRAVALSNQSALTDQDIAGEHRRTVSLIHIQSICRHFDRKRWISGERSECNVCSLCICNQGCEQKEKTYNNGA